MNKNKWFFAPAFVLMLSLVCFAQNPTVDSGFQPAISYVAASYVQPFVQADGKVIAVGVFQTANGLNRYNIARINTDGTTDTTFNCTACTFNISNVAIQSDGKILVAGQAFLTLRDKIIRLNTDGSLDTSFNYIFQQNQQNALTVKGVQPDGRILVTSRMSVSGGFTDTLFRLNTDGSLDNTFQRLTVNLNNGQSVNVKVLPDGRTFLFGNNSYGFLAMLNADGTKSTLFESPALTADVNNYAYITDIALQPDGKIAFLGSFSSVNGLSRKNVARINADQSVDTSFNPTQLTYVAVGGVSGQIIAVSNNKLLIGTTAFPSNNKEIVRLNGDGTTDNTFNLTTTISSFWRMDIDSSERIYVGGFITFPATPNNLTYLNLARFNNDGSLDNTTYVPEILPGGSVSALGLQPDGKILVGGTFSKINDLVKSKISRLNTDGTTDPTFDAGEVFTFGSINDIAVQADGKILVSVFNSNGFSGVRRLTSTGSIDATFNAAANSSVWDLVSQPDGKILIGGVFSNVNGTAKNALARLNADGTLDSSFNVQLGSSTNIRKINLLPDGKIVIAGSFSGINGFNRSNLARLNSDGTLDASFNPTVNPLLDLTIQPDGKYLALNSLRIYRLNSDGTPDSSFTTPTLDPNYGSYSTFVLLNDGTIVVSGNFGTINGFAFYNYVRIKADGAVDNTSFTKSTDRTANVFLKQTDGKILVGGEFKIFENLPRPALARLSFAAVTKPTAFDFDGDARADISVFRPSNNVWYQLIGVNYQFSQRAYGESGDIPVSGDYDADGKADVAVFRPSTGGWLYITSRDNTLRSFIWGSPGDIPLPADFDGNGTTDLVVYRPSNNVWYRISPTTNQFTQLGFGLPGDKPLVGDFDGDGKADYAIYRPSTGAWWYAASSANNAFRAVQWGISTDIPVPADYDGDGKTDFAVYRPSNGGWYILNSGNGTATIQQFGLDGDKPIAADYDGDGKADIAVFRPSNGGWYLLRSTAGFTGIQWGTTGDIPIPGAFVPQ